MAFDAAIGAVIGAAVAAVPAAAIAGIAAKIGSIAKAGTQAVATGAKYVGSAAKSGAKAVTQIGKSGKVVEFQGKTVIQKNKLFDPKAVDQSGRTNIQRMQQKLAPIGTDGKPVNIHHINQTNNGPLTEMLASNHRQNFKILHQNTGQSPSLIDRNAFDTWRGSYWIWRSTFFN
ncbi:MAG: HNH/ENDO VII family nuclease [Chloroflexi bacterium]|nr:HNH/ENDO VII family nuclease [Chloroflexota bacterium]